MRHVCRIDSLRSATRAAPLAVLLSTSFSMLLSMLLSPSAAHAAPPAAERGVPVANDRATKDDYDLDTSGTAKEVKVGASAPFSLVVRPKGDKKVHPEAPLEVTFKETSGVRPGKSKLGRADVVDKAAKAPEVRTTVTAVKPGSQVLEASVSFFLCTDAWCQRMTDRVAVTINAVP